uniref:Uncharacterized protein n=1 Tax=Athene cunicularia TaxID=194338 RepID=A0A663MTU7_ATHCN
RCQLRGAPGSGLAGVRGCFRCSPKTPSWLGLVSVCPPGADCVSGKAFFSTEAELGKLRKLKSGERLFLLLKNHPPLAVSRNKDASLTPCLSLVIDEPKYWLDVLSIWKNIHGCEGGKKIICLKRRSQEETKTATKSRKRNRLCLKNVRRNSGEKPVVNEKLSFRVSCRCSGAVAKILHSQEMGRAVGIALMKQFGWQADLWDPSLEVVVLCFGFFPVCRLPLANREYIRTAGLRSTISWAMASLTEISVSGYSWQRNRVLVEGGVAAYQGWSRKL